MKKIVFTSMIVISCIVGYAQQIPFGDCGIVYIYDAAGNRTKRLYFCNIGVDPYPTTPVRIADSKKTTEVQNTSLTQEEKKNMEFQSVTALYPNPTTGIFYVTFSKALSNAVVNILDVNGKILQHLKANGYRVTCDLSSLAIGTYFIKIEDGNVSITKKVIKQ